MDGCRKLCAKSLHKSSTILYSSLFMHTIIFIVQITHVKINSKRHSVLKALIQWSRSCSIKCTNFSTCSRGKRTSGTKSIYLWNGMGCLYDIGAIYIIQSTLCVFQEVNFIYLSRFVMVITEDKVFMLKNSSWKWR